MVKFILCFFMFMTASSVSSADAVSFEATVNSSKISLNEVLQLTLTVAGVKDNLAPISLPVLDGFSAKYLGPSTRVSIINGDYYSERSFIYDLFPNKAGFFQIPSISATIGGQIYRTQPIDIEVMESPAGTQSSGGQSQNQAPSSESLKDKILVMVSLDQTQAYLNERVLLSIKLLVNDVPMRDIQYPQFEKSGFTVDDFQKPQQYTEVLDGIKYDVVEFKTYIYPDYPGDVQIGPVQIAGNVLYKSGSDSPFNQDMNPFGGDIFKDFFDSYATRPVTLTSQPVEMHVLPLPEIGRPRGFSGAIGQFDFQASVSPIRVKTGDPLTLKMDLKGSGNFKSVEMPVFQGFGFKTYSPQIKDGVDEKTSEEVIIPTTVGIREVPALRFSYFDPFVKNYKTITRGPFAIQVTAPGPDQAFKVVNFSDMAKETSTFPGKQFSFGKILNNIYKIAEKLSRSAWFWATSGFIFVAGTLFYLWRRFQYRLEHDLAFARRFKAGKEAQEALSQGRAYIATGNSKDFYALLSKILHDYLANKWHQSSAALSMEEISGHLKAAQIDETHIAQIKTILEQSDLVCFAGANRDSAQMQSDFFLTRDLIHYLQKHLK